MPSVRKMTEDEFKELCDKLPKELWMEFVERMLKSYLVWKKTQMESEGDDALKNILNANYKLIVEMRETRSWLETKCEELNN